MGNLRKRHHNDGLRKRCDCKRSTWPKCSHPWHFSYMPRRGASAGVHVRRNLDDLVGKEIATKGDAEIEVRRLKAALDAGELVAITVTDAKGRKRIDVRVPADPKRPGEPAPLTLAQLLAEFETHYLTTKRAASLENDQLQVAVINRTPVDRPGLAPRPFGEWLVAEITPMALDRFHALRSVRTKTTAKDAKGREATRYEGGAVTANRNLSLLRAALNWGIRAELLERTPFKRGTETVVRLSKEHSRRRRLEGDEAERLLAACDPLRLNPLTKLPLEEQPPARLRPLVEAALETGARKGELLSLQWWQIKRLDERKPEIFLPAAKTKTRQFRSIPISSRLKSILEMRRNDPSGEPHGPQAFVFGDELGETPARSIKTAWRLACRRAKIEDLHFHDLRREAGSRWLEGGVPLQTVRDWLGHSNISQTSTYLESTLKGQHEAMERFEQQRASGVQASATDAENQVLSVPPDGSEGQPKDRQTIN